MQVQKIAAFSDGDVGGNPAGVLITDQFPPDSEMQKIAAEIGFSETAFVQHLNDNRYSIRFFTPKIEIPLCGHATLASAKVIFDTTALENITFINCNHVES